MAHYKKQLNPKDFFDRVVNFHHKTDISREGKVDLTEFLNAAPVFFMPVLELRREGLFFRAAMQSSPAAHKAMADDDLRLRSEGKTRAQEDAECNQQ